MYRSAISSSVPDRRDLIEPLEYRLHVTLPREALTCEFASVVAESEPQAGVFSQDSDRLGQLVDVAGRAEDGDFRSVSDESRRSKGRLEDITDLAEIRRHDCAPSRHVLEELGRGAEEGRSVFVFHVRESRMSEAAR